jgi:hypothetical protein
VRWRGGEGGSEGAHMCASQRSLSFLLINHPAASFLQNKRKKKKKKKKKKLLFFVCLLMVVWEAQRWERRVCRATRSWPRFRSCCTRAKLPTRSRSFLLLLLLLLLLFCFVLFSCFLGAGNSRVQGKGHRRQHCQRHCPGFFFLVFLAPFDSLRWCFPHSVLQELVADNLIFCEKIGLSNYYWSFPSQALVTRRTKEANFVESIKSKKRRRDDLEVCKNKKISMGFRTNQNVCRRRRTS